MAGCLFHIILTPFRILGMLIVKGVGLAISAAVNANDRKWDKKLEQEYLSAPTTPEKLQKKMTSLFYSRLATQILSYVMMATIFVPLIALIAAGSMSGDELFPILFPCILIAVAGFLLLLINNGISKRTKRLAGIIARPILQDAFGSDVRYEADGQIPNEIISQARFIDGYRWVNGSDLVRGQYKGNPIMFSDITITTKTENTDSDGETSTKSETLFKGFWVVVDFDHVLTPVALNIHEERNPQAIQMESMLFNQKFSVYCPDEHTAFYVLTPDFMEHLLRVETYVHGRIRFQFNKNRLQIAVDTRHDHFEVGTFSSANVEQLQLQFRDEVRVITRLLDGIMRHERLFGKVSEEQKGV